MNSRPYTVHIYEDEASSISKWTLQYPNIETGGDLFGLWLNENEVVIQAVLGPGQNCRRTTTSFFQDEQYLSNAGGLLTNSQGLCNVGSWHSHHTMNIPEPSRGDKDTVWRHLPTPGRFVLLIATIEMKTGAPKVEMRFNLFESTNKGNKVISMKLEILQGQSPIRVNKAVSSQMLVGAEVHSKKTSYPERPVQSGLTKTDYHDCNGFFTGQKSGSRGHRRSHNQNITRDEDVRSYNTPQRADHSEVRTPRSPYIIKYHDLSNGRQGMKFYHYDHPLGSCEDCHNARVVKRSDGKLYVEPHREEEEEEVGCCNIQ